MMLRIPACRQEKLLLGIFAMELKEEFGDIAIVCRKAVTEVGMGAGVLRFFMRVTD